MQPKLIRPKLVLLTLLALTAISAGFATLQSAVPDSVTTDLEWQQAAWEEVLGKPLSCLPPVALQSSDYATAVREAVQYATSKGWTMIDAGYTPSGEGAGFGDNVVDNLHLLGVLQPPIGTTSTYWWVADCKIDAPKA